MRTPVDARLRLEVVRYAFRFTCDECAHFDAESELCSFDYPAAPRRDALEASEVELCKAFELG
jgi:hypothetical protein